MNTKPIISVAQAFIHRNAPSIMIGAGICGFVGTAVAAGRAAIEAKERIDDASAARMANCSDEEFEAGEFDMTFSEIVSETWDCFIPPVVLGIGSAALILGGANISASRGAAAALACQVADAAYAEYQTVVREKYGPEAEQEVLKEVHKRTVEKHPVSQARPVVVHTDGVTLCYDAIAGRYFYSDANRVEHAANVINREIITGASCASLNDFYDEIGIDHTIHGDEVGWNIDSGLVETAFSAIVSDDGTPCLVVDFVQRPKYNFDKLG